MHYDIIPSENQYQHIPVSLTHIKNNNLLLPVLLHPFPSYHHDPEHHSAHKWLYGKLQAMLVLPTAHVQSPERSHLLPNISDLNNNINL
jgi:hypothetical protein